MKETLLIYHDLIEGIVTAMDARDRYTASHSKRVSDIAELICKHMNLSDKERETIHIAAHLHDIGKIGVPDAILIKSTALTDTEWEMMKNHSEIGFQILSKVSRFEKVAEIVRHHHERWDGAGYPLGIAEEQIPMGSRIVALADSIDAMLSNRNYRNALSPAQCRQEIETNAGIMYDPAVVAIVLQYWSEIVSLYERFGIVESDSCYRHKKDGQLY
jgi:putative nucleotidyltransferase with HDIG domain